MPQRMTWNALPDAVHISSYRIRGTETDPDGLLSPAILFSMMQETASYSAAALGLPAEVMDERGLCWMLSRVSLQMQEWPQWGDVIQIASWPRQIDRLYYRREYLLATADHQPLGSATSDWFLADVVSRRAQRPSVMEDLNANFTQVTERAGADDALKIRAGQVGELLRDVIYETRWSDLDRNGHVNNTHYVTWGYNALRELDLVRKPPTEIHINFQQELRAGQTVQVQVYEDSKQIDETTETKHYLLQGLHDESVCFRSIMTF